MRALSALAILFTACGGSSEQTSDLDASTGDDSAVVVDTSGTDGVVVDDSTAPVDTALADTAPIDSGPPPMCPGGMSGPGMAPNGTIPGALTFPFPTIRNATVEWAITGDADSDGIVSVRFRKKGDTAWRRGMPLRRVPAGTLAMHSWSNRHSGSLFDLEPATEYEVEAFLLDPDGGCEIRTGAFTTRTIPAPMAGAPVKPATPSTFAAVAAAAVPGDIIELAAGTYPGFTFPKDGTEGKPIVLRGAGAVTVTGEISLISRKHLYLTGLTVNARIRANLSVGVSIVKNTIKTTEHGVAATLRSENLYIADNTITGASEWNVAALGVDGSNIGEGIWVTGPGHVIEHNRVSGFRDGISLLEGTEATDQFSIDIVENDIRNCADDAVEADFCAHNCRVLRNQLTNNFIALSSQPGLGGPTYFIRNAMYNVILSAFKLQRGSIGDVVLHNTVVKNGDALGIYTSDVFARQYFRNNLFLGGPGGTYGAYSSGTGKVIAMTSAAPSGDYDFDGFGSTTGKFEGQLGSASFTSLADLKGKTTYKNAVELSLSVFAAMVAYPTSPFPDRAPVSLALAAGSAAEDVGVVIPNVNDGFAGKAPDLGAHERGTPAPTYGPR